MHNYKLWINSLGAFGVVHKGDLVTSDGTVKAVAIKTIKCKSIIQINIIITCTYV